MKTALALALTAAAASACANEWIWEECSWSWYRDFCEGESLADGDCGWIYYDEWNLEEFWVSCEEFDDWWWCHE